MKRYKKIIEDLYSDLSKAEKEELASDLTVLSIDICCSAESCSACPLREACYCFGTWHENKLEEYLNEEID